MFGTITANLVRVELMVRRPIEALTWVSEAARYKVELRPVKSELYLVVAATADQLGEHEIAAQLMGKSQEMQAAGQLSHIEVSYVASVQTAIEASLGKEGFDQQSLFGRQLSDEAADGLVRRLIEGHLAPAGSAAGPS